MIPDCATCRHSRVAVSDVVAEGPLLKCHRYPPQLIVLDGNVTQVVPDANEPCGEYEP